MLALLVVAHHPSIGPGVRDAAPLAAQIGSLAAMNRTVHAALLALFAFQTLGFYLFAARLDLRSPAVAAGFGCSFLSLGIMVVPLTLDGMVAADVASWCNGPAGCPPTTIDFLRYTAALIQEFTKAALVVQGVGIACFGAKLLRDRANGTAVAAGLLGVACGVAEAGTILAAPLRLTPHSLVLILTAQALWSLAAAALLGSGRVSARR